MSKSKTGSLTTCPFCHDFECAARDTSYKWNEHIKTCRDTYDREHEQGIKVLKQKHKRARSTMVYEHQQIVDGLVAENTSLKKEVKALKKGLSSSTIGANTTQTLDEIAQAKYLLEVSGYQLARQTEDDIDSMIQKLDILCGFKCVSYCRALMDIITGIKRNPTRYYSIDK